MARVLILAAGGAFIFAAFINNKVPVYLPHVMLGFALAAGFAVSEIASRGAADRSRAPDARIRRRLRRDRHRVLRAVVFDANARASWCRTKTTEATLRAIVPAGPKYVFASPQFWTPFHAEPGTTFYSYAAAQPLEAGTVMTLAGAADDRPIVLVVDEYQWLPELVGVSSTSTAWQRAWISLHRAALFARGVALGTAHGTLAAYRCGLASAPQQAASAPRIVGGATDLSRSANHWRATRPQIWRNGRATTIRAGPPRGIRTFARPTKDSASAAPDGLASSR